MDAGEDRAERYGLSWQNEPSGGFLQINDLSLI